MKNNLTGPNGLRPGLLLDRDGVLNAEQGYVCHPDQLLVHVPLAPLLCLAEELGMPRVVITNQAGIAKGLYNHQTLAAIHQKLEAELAQQGASVSEVLYCPHHPDVSGACLCRKPARLLFERALARWGLDPAQTWMIGDRARDLIPAQQLGLHTVLVGRDPAALMARPRLARWQYDTVNQAAQALMRKFHRRYGRG